MTSEANAKLVAAVVKLAADLTPLQDRIIVEDTTGRKFRVIQSYPVGAATKDPGILVRIQEFI